MPLPRTRLADLVRASARGMRTTPSGVGQAGAALREVASFGDNPGNLRMTLHVPHGLLPGAPLLVALHGCKQDAGAYVRGTGWATLADRHGFAVLAPEQRPGNNFNNCLNWFEPADQTRGSGEAASIRAMIAHAVATHHLDARRVFITGLSAGGAMTAVMLATYPEVFAGGAIIAGLPFGVAHGVPAAFEVMRQGSRASAEQLAERVRAASPHRGPWPRVAVWHGDADHTVAPANAAELVAQWGALHGVTGDPTVSRPAANQICRQWRDASGIVVVESHMLAGLAHGVPIAAGHGPGTCGEAAPFILEAGVSSSDTIAAFFGLAAAVPRRAGVIAVAKDGTARPNPGAAPSPGPDTAAADAEHPVAAFVGDVIRRALAAAGLTKR